MSRTYEMRRHTNPRRKNMPPYKRGEKHCKLATE